MKPAYFSSIDEPSVKVMAVDSKVGVLATEDESGYPHLSFISSIQAFGSDKLTFGQFSAGLSKQFIAERPNVGFLVLSADKRWCSGNAVMTHSETTGTEFDLYNNKPLFRYNSYMGFYRIFYLNLDRITRFAPLPMGASCTRCRISERRSLPSWIRSNSSRITTAKAARWFCLSYRQPPPEATVLRSSVRRSAASLKRFRTERRLPFSA